MELDIISYDDLINPSQGDVHQYLEKALLEKGIVGVQGIPEYTSITQKYIEAARQFMALDEAVREKYAPLRDSGDTEGYESGAEKFMNKAGEWQVDDKKVSYYAYLPPSPNNKWPAELDFKGPYEALSKLIFNTGKHLLKALHLDDAHGLIHETLSGHCRMLYYRQEKQEKVDNTDWCGAHFDHGVLTGLIPAYYFYEGQEIEEPPEAGLYVKPILGQDFEKVSAKDKSILYFQMGEFGQLLSNDRFSATEHMVKKTGGNIERYTFALFYCAADDTLIRSSSVLTQDTRYQAHQRNNEISFFDWSCASFDRYRHKQSG